ncbi:MAG TPA: hypothetical protein VN256_11620 [Pyrinomonadaceae bacterium]|nr:hypothetical protein [Pyrinomonadaceae bacterium]
MKFWLALMLLTLSASAAAFQSLPQKRVYLELGNTKVTENGESVMEVGGKCGAGQVLAFHLPEKGWFVASVEPFAGYDFQKIGKLKGNKIVFRLDNRKYEIISDQPISSQARSLDLWVVRIAPPADKAHTEGKAISCSTDFKYWLETVLQSNKRQ